MGSITEEDYQITIKTFEKYYHSILLVNKNPILHAIKNYHSNLYGFTALNLPENIPYSQTYTLYLSKEECHISFLHYILKSWETFDEFYREFQRHFHGQILRAVKPIQRRWREAYYNPDTGIWIQKYSHDIAKRNGMKP